MLRVPDDPQKVQPGNGSKSVVTNSMQITVSALSQKQLGLILISALILGGLVAPQVIRAQRGSTPAVAQVGPGAPLPVYVVNEVPPSLPDGFVPGTSWRFTTWTVPSTLTFSASVERISGGWAYLTLQTDASKRSRWYYIPEMPGGWEQL